MSLTAFNESVYTIAYHQTNHAELNEGSFASTWSWTSRGPWSDSNLSQCQRQPCLKIDGTIRK